MIFAPILGEPLASQMSDMLMYQIKLWLEDLELINTSVKVKQHLEVAVLTAPFLTMIYVSSTDFAVLVFWIITSSMFHAALADVN